MRLDIHITRLFPQITRSQAKRLIENGNVKVGGVACNKPSHVVQDRDEIKLDLPPPELPLSEPQEIPIDILYEDKDIVVVNKSPGMVVHPGPGNRRGTLVNALLHHCKDLSGIGGCLRPGIVHRLDKGTSGVMVVAKNDAAHLHLSSQFKNRGVEKRYYALVYGRLPKEEGIINVPIGRAVSDRKKMSTRTRKGRIAETHYKVLERYGGDLTLIEVRLATGRTHQIRVHLAHLGHPLVGDDLYGGGKAIKRLKNNKLIDIVELISRPFLHAYKLAFVHPVSGKRIEFTSGLPSDLTAAIDELRNL